ncbi:MAG: cysteine--tRNA ligase, partial [Vallitaleaceae bacterium]|nr:cysteine--tRNA ligase [Vallitaleaceae bacterium]
EVNGTVYFASNRFPEYGKLSKKNIEELEAGKRIAVEDEKRNSSDFVLWKPKKENEPYWESPWSQGRPGWHIECSVMAKKYLGPQIDIHAGGTDLIFPHHENEIAQSETANGVPFAKYWMHNGFINVDNEKMSKSKGNFFTVREISEQIPYEVIRFFLLNAHYRSPINFSKDLMESAEKSLERIRTGYENLNKLYETKNAFSKESDLKNLSEEQTKIIKEFTMSFEVAMEDDFNTATAISTIFEMVRFSNSEFNETTDFVFLREFYKLFVKLCDILGLSYQREEVLLDQEIEALIQKRQEARKNKDFQLADQVRDDLLAKGIVLEDTREGVRFKRI